MPIYPNIIHVHSMLDGERLYLLALLRRLLGEGPPGC